MGEHQDRRESRLQECLHYLDAIYQRNASPTDGSTGISGYRHDIGLDTRSESEANFARILRLENADFKYEPNTFLFDTDERYRHHFSGKAVSSFTPDFRTTNHLFMGKLVDVCDYWDDEAKELEGKLVFYIELKPRAYKERKNILEAIEQIRLLRQQIFRNLPAGVILVSTDHFKKLERMYSATIEHDPRFYGWENYERRPRTLDELHERWRQGSKAIMAPAQI